jgi:NADH-quinone oxidoreductase subunit J
VMMLDINIDKMRENFWGYFPLAATVGVVIVLEMSAVLLHGFWTIEPQVPAAAANIGDTKELGKLIFTEYVYAFEIAAVILLVAIVAAVSLTMRRRKDTKYFSPSDAVKVKRNDRIRIVSMKSESVRANGNGGNGDADGNAQPASAAAEKQ